MYRAFVMVNEALLILLKAYIMIFALNFVHLLFDLLNKTFV